MSEADPAPFFAHRIENPERIPSARYYDQGFFALEAERLWPHVWQMAARLEQIPEIGDWTTYEILGRSVIVVHTANGVKAYHNACRHRGVRLARGHGNCRKQGFICPFHGWRWNSEGQNTFVYGRHLFAESQLDAADLNLPEVRSEVWGGCLFINFDDGAPGYRETIGPLIDRFDAHRVDDLRAEWWYATVLPANWKVAMEAFMEGYHVLRTHPQLHDAFPPLYHALYGGEAMPDGERSGPAPTARQHIHGLVRYLEVLSEGMAGMVHAKEVEIARELADVDLPEDRQQATAAWYALFHDRLTERLRARGENVPDLNRVKASHRVSAIEFLFPNYFLLPMFTSMSSYRIRPLTAESCYFEIWSLTHVPAGKAHEAPRQPIVLPYDSPDFPAIPRQDYANIPEQQIGLHAGGFDFMRLGSRIEGLISNYQRIIDGYLAGTEQARLNRAIHMLGGNFDGPVLDLGL